MEITENRLIEKIGRLATQRAPVERGIGDDGAVVRLDRDSYVFVQDALVERVHFDLAIERIRDVGKKAVYINVSDILAMGAEPLYFLVTVGIPPRITSAMIEDLYRGMDRAAKEFSVTLIGGDTVETEHDFVVDVSMAGRLVVPEYLGRNKARIHDLIAVTGNLGEAAYGLSLLNERDGKGSNAYTRRYTTPRPPIECWRTLIQAGIPRAMMDISDGLLLDLERMMKESRAGAVISQEEIPMPSVLRRSQKEDFALAGGEDYQLLFTFDPSRLRDVEALKTTYPRLSVIGKVVRGKGVKLLEKGLEKKTIIRGYEHFRQKRAHR